LALVKRLLVYRLQNEGFIPQVVINDYQNARIDAGRFRENGITVTPISGTYFSCGSREEVVEALYRIVPQQK